jgi:hypothetical protein
MVESPEPRNAALIVYGLFASILLFLVINGAIYFFHHVREGEFRDKVELAPTSDLNQLRADENQALHHYQIINREQKVVRIPIERAIELESQHPWRTHARLSGEAPTSP